MPMNARRSFNNRQEQAVDEASDALKSLFYDVGCAGAYHLPESELELLLELTFKVQLLRSAIVQHDISAPGRSWTLAGKLGQAPRGDCILKSS